MIVKMEKSLADLYGSKSQAARVIYRGLGGEKYVLCRMREYVCKAL